jgi:hypothetical protein
MRIKYLRERQKIKLSGFFLFMYDIQHCFVWRPSDSPVLEDHYLAR